MNDTSGEFEQAERCLRSCKLLMSDGDTLGAVDRLYYGLYHAARAALAHRDIGVFDPATGSVGTFVGIAAEEF